MGMTQDVVAVSLVGVEDVPVYTPALLLDARLSASITDHPDFAERCEVGFLFVQEMMLEDVREGIFPYSRSVIAEFVEANVLTQDKTRCVRALAAMVGFVLGGLSVMALGQCEGVSEGLELLRHLVSHWG